ncbi:hypothetical protein Tco_0205515 [Tanacetum coccineum]
MILIRSLMMKPPTHLNNTHVIVLSVEDIGWLYVDMYLSSDVRINYTDEVCALCCYEVEKSFVNDSNSFIDSPNIFYPPSQPQTSSLDQWHCFHCKDLLERGERCKRCSCKWCGSGLRRDLLFCASNNKNSSIGDPNPNSFNDSQNLSDYPPQPQYQTNSCELCGNDAHYGYDCPPQVPFVYNQDPCFNQNFDNNFPQTSPSFPQQYLCWIIKRNSTNAITPDLPTEEPDNSLSIGDEHLNTNPEIESDEVIKSSVEDLVPIPSKSEGISDDTCDVPFCDNSPPLDVLNDPFEIFSDFNDDCTSSDDDSFEKHRDVNPLFDEVLENIESKDSYVSNLDEPALLVTPLSDANEDECFNPRGDINEIDAFLDIVVSTDIMDDYYDSEGDIIYLESLLIKDTTPNLPPEVFLDHDPRSLKDKLDKEDLKSMVKVFDPGIHKKKFSPTYVSLSFEDRHYLSFTYVIRIFLPYFTYPVESSSLPLSSGSEDIIFDPGISAFHFSSLEPVAYEYPMEVCSSTCFIPNILMIWGEIALDYEDSRARGFVHRSLDLQSFASLFMGIRYPRSY